MCVDECDVCVRGIAGVPVLFFLSNFSHFHFHVVVIEVSLDSSLSLSILLSLSLDNNFAYDTTISGIRRC